MFCTAQSGRYSVARYGSWRHGIADAFFLAAFCGLRPVRISERDAHRNPRATLISEDPEDPRVLGEEQRAVGQDGNLTLG
jgi:hypothetical protein